MSVFLVRHFLLVVVCVFCFFSVNVVVSVMIWWLYVGIFFFFQAEDGIRDIGVTGVQTCALPI